VRRYIECNNIILLVVGFEFFEVVVIVAVKDKQPIFALRTRYYMEIEVPNLIYTFLISNLPVISTTFPLTSHGPPGLTNQEAPPPQLTTPNPISRTQPSFTIPRWPGGSGNKLTLYPLCTPLILWTKVPLDQIILPTWQVRLPTTRRRPPPRPNYARYRDRYLNI